MAKKKALTKKGQMRGCFDVLSITSLYTKCKHFLLSFLRDFFICPRSASWRGKSWTNCVLLQSLVLQKLLDTKRCVDGVLLILPDATLK